jgi:hypothetical protein
MGTNSPNPNYQYEDSILNLPDYTSQIVLNQTPDAIGIITAPIAGAIATKTAQTSLDSIYEFFASKAINFIGLGIGNILVVIGIAVIVFGTVVPLAKRTRSAIPI